MKNEEVTVEVFGKQMPAMKMLRALVEDLAEYQTAVELAWRDAATSLGCGELLDADELRGTLDRIRTTTDAAMAAVRHNQEVRRTQADTAAVCLALAKCPRPTNDATDDSARHCIETGQCACTVGEQYVKEVAQ